MKKQNKQHDNNAVSVKNIRRLVVGYRANRIAIIGICTALAKDALPPNKSFFVIPAQPCPFQTTPNSNIITFRGSAAAIAAGDSLTASSIDLVILHAQNAKSMSASIASFWPKLHHNGTLAAIRSIAYTHLFQVLFNKCGFRTRRNFLVVKRYACKFARFPPSCAATLEVARRSYCPGKRSRWLAKIAWIIASNDMVYFNVGANKGYNVAEFLQTFRHNGTAGVGNRAWHSSLTRLHPSIHAPCGTCRSTCTLPTPATTYNVSAKVYAFELLEGNALLLQRLFETHSIQAEVIHAAVLNHTGVAYAPRARPGEEKFGVHLGPRSNAWRVTAITLDDFAQRRDIQQISILDVDAEGSDALVLEGTQRMLSLKRVRILQFEYHGVGMWSSSQPGGRSLKDVISKLYRWSYECFFDGNNGQLAPVSGINWCDKLEIRQWSNLICAHEPLILKQLRMLVYD